MSKIYTHFLKIFFLLLSSILLAIYLSSIFIEKIYVNSSIENLKNFTENTIKKLNPMDNKQKDFLNIISEVNKIRITLIKENGEVIFDSHSNPELMENHINREEVLNSLQYGEASSIRLSNTLNTKMVYYAKKVKLNDKTYIFRTAKEISDLTHFIKPYKSKFLLLIGGFFLIISSFTFLYLKNFVRKLDNLQLAITKISTGDFNTLITAPKNDILYPISNKINILSQSLKNLTEDIKSQKELLSNILENLPFPVVIFDESKECLVQNRYFRNFLTDINNLDALANLIRDENLYNTLNRFEKGENDFNLEINLKDKFFSIFCNKLFYQNNPLILLTFIDITEIKKIEKMKADFTANVSHELKTPITVLKGYIETLEEEISDDKKHIVSILKKHIERLSNLVSDVLLLSRLDAKVPLEKDIFNLKELVINAIDTFKSEITAKSINVKIDIDDKINFYGDSFLIFQALINLISNAVKYTPNEGYIEITTTISDEKLVLKISDTGPGIPKEYYEKIFERFFVIDKSRSRQLGGTGLGLAIVKHIVELHNGKIAVESELGKGTTFFLTLTLNTP